MTLSISRLSMYVFRISIPTREQNIPEGKDELFTGLPTIQGFKDHLVPKSHN